MTVAAVILAAGSGSRFNEGDSEALPGAKLLSVVNGQALITWAVLPALAAGFDDVVVVDGAADLHAALPDSVNVIRNADWAKGQATSLRVGLDWCADRGHEAAVIGLGDAPGLSPRAWRSVADSGEGLIVFATYEGRRGHPVRLSSEIWSMLPSSGDEGARSLARQYPELVREVPCSGSPDDVDTREDLQRWS